MAEKRSAFAVYMNIQPSGGSPTYAMVGDGVTELTVSYNPQTTTEQFINQDTANTDITGYQPNAPVTSQVVKGNEVFEFVNGLRKKLAILSDAYTDVILVDVFEKAADKTYAASRQPVSIQIDSYGGSSTDPLSLSYTINWRGDGEEGTFNPDTKTFTPGLSAASLSLLGQDVDKVEV